MAVRKWVIQYALALPLAFVVLGGIQFLKGKDIGYCLEFGLLWSVLSVSVFAGTRIYYYRKGMYCAVCNDLPANNPNTEK
ncbi:hypothetical protein DXV75_15455 [Alteromonas aestuariivivens]|uniref:Uncharacterized protein n=1 Tax=Alteromonas aestuariivivens TaxID=1938339 RepID=A0A3D8M3L5_9ALTE|nr:hypothetical protein [Alteromonas aestuariivivens]RDV24221.1 hypothetical protein DXV75_15455 [Alteromonas aestuariivivens]